jgi:hypothetical protein
MPTLKRFATAFLFTTLLLPMGCAPKTGPYVTKVDNGVARKIPAACVSEEKLLARGCVKTSDMQGNAVYLCNKPEMPEGPIAARGDSDDRRHRSVWKESKRSGGRRR